MNLKPIAQLDDDPHKDKQRIRDAVMRCVRAYDQQTLVEDSIATVNEALVDYQVRNVGSSQRTLANTLIALSHSPAAQIEYGTKGAE